MRTHHAKSSLDAPTTKGRRTSPLPPPYPEPIFTPESTPKLTEFTTDHFTSKMWIDPEDRTVALHTWHYEYFRDNPEIATRYKITFSDETSTRLAALRAGFIRVNYERQGGFLTAESMRWDRRVRGKINQLITDNADAIDHVRIHILQKTGIAIQVGYVSLMMLRWAGKPINRKTMGSWNNFRTAKI